MRVNNQGGAIMPQSIYRTFRGRNPPTMIAWLGGPTDSNSTFTARGNALVHPVALGSGLRLFPELAAPIRLKLVGATTFKTGTVAKDFRSA
jgi:hypothetical protein